VLKISLPDKDVKTASPEELAVDSTYDTLKLIVRNSNPYFGEILVIFNSNPPVGTYNIFNYVHELGKYTPLYYVFFDRAKSSKLLGTNTSFDTATLFSNFVMSGLQDFIVTDTPTGFRFDYVVGSNGLFDMSGQYFSFRYFVYVNDGA
jgi:hypothetical protein